MKQVVEKKWDELLPVWNELYHKNNTATPFQSYEFLTLTKKGKPYRKDLFRLVGLKEWNLVLYKDGCAIAIAPLLVKKERNRHVVYLRGHFTAANQLDFIYGDWSHEDFRFLMDYIVDTLGDASFFLDRVSEKTVTCGYLKEYFAEKKIEEQECFAISTDQSHDDWLKSLSKSVRRNLKTHYNRLQRDNLEWSIRVFTGQKLDGRLSKQMMGVYADRFIVKNSLNFGPLKKPVVKMLQMFLLRDKITRWLSSSEDNFHIVLYISGDVAAFSSGIICSDKRIIMARLAILTKYARYGPWRHTDQFRGQARDRAKRKRRG